MPQSEWEALVKANINKTHPNTLGPRADHLVNAIWPGKKLPLNESTLPEHITSDAVEHVLIDNRPG